MPLPSLWCVPANASCIEEVMAENEKSIKIELVLKGDKWLLIQDWAEELAALCVAHAEALEVDCVPVLIWDGSVKTEDKNVAHVMMTAEDIECEVEVFGDAIWRLTRLDFEETK